MAPPGTGTAPGTKPPPAVSPWKGIPASVQEAHHKKETFQEEFLRILKKYQAPYDERYLWD